jgi:hypothetical protein
MCKTVVYSTFCRFLSVSKDFTLFLFIVLILFVSLWPVDDYSLVYAGLGVDDYFIVYYGFGVELC